MDNSIISSKKQADLAEWMARLGLLESDIVEKFITGSGSGGQKVNKTASCVYLKHSPSGIEVKYQKNRSRALNRFMARRLLCEKMAEITEGEQTKKQKEIQKKRAQKKRRSRRSKEKMLDDKNHISKKKENRKPLKGED